MQTDASSKVPTGAARIVIAGLVPLVPLASALVLAFFVDVPFVDQAEGWLVLIGVLLGSSLASLTPRWVGGRRRATLAIAIASALMGAVGVILFGGMEEADPAIRSCGEGFYFLRIALAFSSTSLVGAAIVRQEGSIRRAVTGFVTTSLLALPVFWLLTAAMKGVERILC